MTCRYGYRLITEDLGLEVGLEPNGLRVSIALLQRLVSSFVLLLTIVLSWPLLSFSLLT